MNKKAQVKEERVVCPVTAKVDSLKPANASIRTAERELKRQVPAVHAAVQRLEDAKVVSQAALSFKFSI